MANYVVHEGYFAKEGSWVRTWKRRFYQITKDGKITYRETKESKDVLGIFDISGRLDISRDVKNTFEGKIGLSIFSSSTGRKLNVRLIDFQAYKKFLIGIAQSCLFHNVTVGSVCAVRCVHYICG